MGYSVTIMQWFLFLCCVSLAAATYPKSVDRVPAPCQRPDLNFVRQNAENLAFVEYLRRQAAENDLYGFKSIMGSDDFQGRVDEFRSIDCGIDETPLYPTPNCNTNCEYNSQQMIIFKNELQKQRALIQRLYSQVLALSQVSCTSKTRSVLVFS